jgi:hypothetical protein
MEGNLMPARRARGTTFGASLALAAASMGFSVPVPAEHAVPVVSGEYEATLTRPRAVDPVVLIFDPDGSVCLSTDVLVCRGSWRRAGWNSFTYRIDEPLVGNDGVQTGWVQLHQEGTFTGTSFASTGESVITDLDGNVLGTSPAAVTASPSWADFEADFEY